MSLYTSFAALHTARTPLVLPTVWDPGSATTAVAAGAAAVGTTSWAVAASRGTEDGERLGVDLVLDVVARIVSAVDVPVTADLERGYGRDAAAVGDVCRAAAGAGAVGCNLEDSLPGAALRPAADAGARIAAAREAVGDEFWINARTDVLFRGLPVDEDLVDEAVARAVVYREAGASSLFLPGATDPALPVQIARRSGLPVTVMVTDLAADLSVWTAPGVVRVSRGPALYLAAMDSLTRAVSG